jgi:uncharacterized protein
VNLSEPLSDEELQELEEFLLSAANEDCMDLSMLDGFLTALAVGPNTLAPSLWLPRVWGGEAVWQSKEQAERILSLVFRHANAIVFYLRDDPDVFEPILYERDEGEGVLPMIDDWCSGFVAGMALDEEGWRPLMDADEGDDLLYPILLYGTEGGWEARQAHPELEARLQDTAAALGDCVMGIHAWWLPTRKANSTLRRDEPKVGRNDLCPCGSGRKYKRCCGAPERLH